MIYKASHRVSIEPRVVARIERVRPTVVQRGRVISPERPLKSCFVFLGGATRTTVSRSCSTRTWVVDSHHLPTRRCGATWAQRPQGQRPQSRPHALPGRLQDLVRQLQHSRNLHGDHQGRVADADRARRAPRKGPPLPHARRRPSRARVSERPPRTHVPLTG